jgi:hypothetical protein
LEAEEAIQTSTNVSEDPVVKVITPVFANLDVRDKDIGSRNRSKLSDKITGRWK